MRTATVRLPGHPDQACDMVAEAIVDEYVRRDPESRLRVNVVGGRGVMFVSGDILSQADFDVAALVRRTLGAIGVTDDVEPFVSLEPVSSERIAAFRLPSEIPTTVTGYATAETDLFLPAPVALARKIAKELHEAREQDAEWFWLGPDSEVTVIAKDHAPSRIVVMVEHANEPLASVRQRIADRLRPLIGEVLLEVNPTGPRERRGLAGASGASGRGPSVYGSFLPAFPTCIGRDPSSVEKAGAWLLRSAAISAVRAGARSVLIQATYSPEEMRPFALMARDERGRDITSSIPLEALSLDRVIKEWWRPGLNLDAATWGFAGQTGMPWEEA